MTKVGDKLPNVTLINQDLKSVNLGELKGKVTVLAFFPAAFTSVCTKEMCTFRDNLSKFNNLNATVFGISVDPPFSNKAFKEANKLNFDLLSDFNREAVRAFEIETELPVLKGYKLAKRSVFVADKEGVIRYVWVSEDAGKEPNYSEIEEVVKKLNS
ncbi:peroxiredoxin [Sulfolobales archaeon HS-7]|nr:peroxiredoxin [Sulfolobales archaeon HS-7]